MLLICAWVFTVFQGIHLQCYDSQDNHGFPPDWQMQNSIVFSGYNQVYCLRSYIVLYACREVIPIRKYQHPYSTYHISLLLLCGNIESHPGPESFYALRHPKMCGFFRTAVFLVFVAEQDLLDPKIIVWKKDMGLKT